MKSTPISAYGQQGEFSKELCGGTHLSNTSEVGTFEVMVEESVSAGTRRIEALTGKRAVEHRKQVEQTLADAAKVLDCAPEGVAESIRNLVQDVRALKKQLAGGGAAPTATTAAKKTPGRANNAAKRAVAARGFAIAERIAERCAGPDQCYARRAE